MEHSGPDALSHAARARAFASLTTSGAPWRGSCGPRTCRERRASEPPSTQRAPRHGVDSRLRGGRWQSWPIRGAAAIQTLHAQAAPKAYVVAQNVVKDEARYMKDFAPSMSKAIEAAGGKYLVRGGKTISMHGAAPASRVVILQFDSVDKAQAWANAAATKALFATGEKYATLNDYIVEGDSDFRPCCSQQQFKRSSLNRHRLLR